MKTMMKLLTLVLLVMSLSGVTALTEGIPPYQAATAGEADVRAEADGMSVIILTVPDGTPLTVLGVEGDWVHVRVKDVTGFVYIDSVIGVTHPEPEEKEMKVTIFTNRREVMQPGESVTLTSKLTGFEGYEVTYQWECDMGDGFLPVPGGNQESYTFAASIQTLSYHWRLVVYANLTE